MAFGRRLGRHTPTWRTILNIRVKNSIQQRTRDVTTYYNELMVVWQELDLFAVEECESSKDSARYRKTKERFRVSVFLAGLNFKQRTR